MHDSALAQAHRAEDEIRAGNWRGPLHGIPIGLKDLIDTAGVRTTCASALFLDRVPTEDAEIVGRLKNAGAVLIGKQNMQEFAYGGTSTSSYFGAVHNPWDIERILPLFRLRLSPPECASLQLEPIPAVRSASPQHSAVLWA